ncbi:MAG TPA: hypothetical protein VIL29_12435 [Pseudothermotoga sp.]
MANENESIRNLFVNILYYDDEPPLSLIPKEICGKHYVNLQQELFEFLFQSRKKKTKKVKEKPWVELPTEEEEEEEEKPSITPESPPESRSKPAGLQTWIESYTAAAPTDNPKEVKENEEEQKQVKEVESKSHSILSTEQTATIAHPLAAPTDAGEEFWSFSTAPSVSPPSSSSSLDVPLSSSPTESKRSKFITIRHEEYPPQVVPLSEDIPTIISDTLQRLGLELPPTDFMLTDAEKRPKLAISDIGSHEQYTGIFLVKKPNTTTATTSPTIPTHPLQPLPEQHTQPNTQSTTSSPVVDNSASLSSPAKWQLSVTVKLSGNTYKFRVGLEPTSTFYQLLEIIVKKLKEKDISITADALIVWINDAELSKDHIMQDTIQFEERNKLIVTLKHEIP